MIKFEYLNYVIFEDGRIQNKNTGKFLKVEEKSNGKFTKIYTEGKSKRINLTELINEYKIKIENEKKSEEKSEKSENESKSYISRKYIIRVTENNGTIREFKTFKKANDFYGLRKDYLNYCISEKFKHMLTKGDLDLKSVEKVQI